MQKLLDFFGLVGNLKRVKRTGWVLRKVPNPESVAEHSFRTAVLAMVVVDEFGLKVNKEKLLKMALIHDLAESVTGDLTPYKLVGKKEKARLEKALHGINSNSLDADEFGKYWDGLAEKTREKKFFLEKKAMQKLASKLKCGKELLSVWNEYEERKTPEAKLLKQLDVFEMVLQALEYEKQHSFQGTLLDDFWPGARKHLQDGPLSGFFEFVSNREKKIRKKATARRKR